MTSTPSWFTETINNLQFENHTISVLSDLDSTSAQIHYQLFRPPSTTTTKRCGIVLVHGGGAHSRWWDWTAPYLAADGHLVACLDLSGQGDSENRDLYAMTTNAIEVMEVARALKTKHNAMVPDKPIIIGHSYGGWVTLVVGKNYGNELGGTIVLDSSVRPSNHPMNKAGPPMRKKKPGTKTKEELKKRFRLMPPQPIINQYLLDYIFPLSVTDKRGKWEWKDDAERFSKHVDFKSKSTMNQMAVIQSQRLRGQKCRLSLLYGEHSLFFEDKEVILNHMRKELEMFPPKGQIYTPIIMIPNSHHHLMFDQPLMTVTVLRTILNEWYASDRLKESTATRMVRSRL